MHRSPALSTVDDIDLMAVMTRLWQKKALIVGCALFGLLLGIIYLHESTPTYTAVLKVTPAASSQAGITTSRSSNLSGLAAMAGVSLGSSGGASPFELYLDTLQSRELAEQLVSDPLIMRQAFAAEWDAQAGAWRKPHSTLKSAADAAKRALGFPMSSWKRPNAARLQDYLSSSLIIEESADSPITRIQYDHRDPSFAAYLLSKANRAADQLVRRRALNQAVRYADYLSTRMRSAVVAEHRSMLANALAEQERSIMLASSGVPYAADAVEAPIASEQPTQPKPGLTLAATTVGFALIGIFFALLDLVALARGVGVHQPHPSDAIAAE